MTPEEYMALADVTVPREYKYFTSEKMHPDLVHAWIGVTTETGESGDVVKKALIYGKDPDLINLDEEFGDKLWYIALYCSRRQISFSDLMEQNIAKLQKRFPDKFSEELALTRDLPAERKALEQAALKRDKVDDMSLTRKFIHLNKRPPTNGDELYLPEVVRKFRYEYHVDGVEPLWSEIDAAPLR